MPPPTPSRPAITPASAPITTRSAASGRSCGEVGQGHGGGSGCRRPPALARPPRRFKGNRRRRLRRHLGAARAAPAPARRPRRCALSDSIRRQARAPGRPWKAPSMCRVIWLQPRCRAAARPRCRAASPRTAASGRDVRPGRAEDRAGRPPRAAPARGRRRGRSSRRRARAPRNAAASSSPAMPPLTTIASSGKRRLHPQRRGRGRAAGSRGSPSGSAPRARPCARGSRPGAPRPPARSSRKAGSTASGSCSSTPIRHFTVTGTGPAAAIIAAAQSATSAGRRASAPRRSSPTAPGPTGSRR